MMAIIVLMMITNLVFNMQHTRLGLEPSVKCVEVALVVGRLEAS
jgi:hypothetical protein